MNHVARLKVEYRDKIVPTLIERNKYKSPMQVPKITKIVLSQGLGQAVADKKIVDYAVDEMTIISGQKAVAT